MVQLLRERGADPYRKNNTGATPISTAYLVAGDELRGLFSDLPAAVLAAPGVRAATTSTFEP